MIKFKQKAANPELNIQSGHILSSSWASSDDVWISMLNKELKYFHDKSYLQRHPKLQPKMRAILLDWLLEVRGRGFTGLGSTSMGVSMGNKVNELFPGERGVQPPPANGVPGPRFLRPFHADSG